jgi:hypothetical protein
MATARIQHANRLQMEQRQPRAHCQNILDLISCATITQPSLLSKHHCRIEHLYSLIPFRLDIISNEHAMTSSTVNKQQKERITPFSNSRTLTSSRHAILSTHDYIGSSDLQAASRSSIFYPKMSPAVKYGQIIEYIPGKPFLFVMEHQIIIPVAQMYFGGWRIIHIHYYTPYYGLSFNDGMGFEGVEE